MKPLSEKNFAENVLKHGAGGLNIDGCRVGTEQTVTRAKRKGMSFTSLGNGQGFNGCDESINQGRFPSNVILDEEAGAMLNGEARFFYCAKASSSERNAGMRWDSEKKLESGIQRGSYGSFNGRSNYYKNYHVSVKPLNLMRYLVRLVTPKGGIVLEPFAGSGTTLLAAKKEGFEFVGIERELEYCKIAEQRLESVAINGTLF
jgi:site-specific DNA-methyltransferase (adenine-specific)